MKHKLEMIEGPESWDRFKAAMKTLVKVPKSAVPSPFGKRVGKKKKDAREKTNG